MAIRARKSVDGSTAYQAVYRSLDDKQKTAGTFGTRQEAEGAYLVPSARSNRASTRRQKH